MTRFIRHIGPVIGFIILSMIVTVVTGNPFDIRKSRETAITKAIEKVSPAVASINIIQIRKRPSSPFFNDPFFQYFWFPDEFYKQEVKSLGSGVVISPDGYILTNQHVVAGASEIIITLPGGDEFDGEIVGMDKTSDVALLKIEGKNLPYANLGSSKNLILGEWVIALGNPFGLFDVNKQPSATVGIISALNMNFGREQSGRIFQGMIQTDAAINPGNSGGPLCNASGEVIGINTFIFTGGGYSEGNIGIGFAIPIDRARRIAEELKKYGRVDRSFSTGLKVQRVDRFLAEYLNLPSITGVIITEVEAKSPADKAGLKVGDVILNVDGEPVKSRNDILNVIEEREQRAGDKIGITYYRNGKKRTTSLRLASG